MTAMVWRPADMISGLANEARVIRGFLWIIGNGTRRRNNNGPIDMFRLIK